MPFDDENASEPCCPWTQPEDCDWRGSCGYELVFEDSGPEEMGFKFCPFCGKKLVVIAEN